MPRPSDNAKTNINDNTYSLNALINATPVVKQDQRPSNEMNQIKTDVNSSSSNNYSLLKGIEMGGQFYNQIGSYLNNSTNDNLSRPHDATDSNLNSSKNIYENVHGIQSLVLKPKIESQQTNKSSENTNTQKSSNDINNRIIDALVSTNPLLNSSGNKTTFANLAKPGGGGGGTTNSSDNYLKDYERDVAMRDTNTINQTGGGGVGGIYGIANMIEANPISPVHHNKNQTSWATTQVIKSNNEDKQNGDNSEGQEFRRRK